jgi:hypothetical protein
MIRDHLNCPGREAGAICFGTYFASARCHRKFNADPGSSCLCSYHKPWQVRRFKAARFKRRQKKVFEWSYSTGIVPAGTSIQSQKHRNTATKDPLAALDQVIEQVDEPRSESVKEQPTLFNMDARGRQLTGWTNKLIWGDNKIILSSLKNGPLREEIEAQGGIKLIYIDPPFDVGADFSMDIEIGDDPFTKKPLCADDRTIRTIDLQALLFIIIHSLFFEKKRKREIVSFKSQDSSSRSSDRPCLTS